MLVGGGRGFWMREGIGSCRRSCRLCSMSVVYVLQSESKAFARIIIILPGEVSIKNIKIKNRGIVYYYCPFSSHFRKK